MREIKFRAYNTKPNSTSFKVGHKKLGGFIMGSKHTEAAKEKVRRSLFGKRGELARNWQGGKTAINTIVRYSTEAKLWRKAVFERDNYTCVRCLRTNGEGEEVILNADHIFPFAFFPSVRFKLENGRTLCRECHKKTPTFAGRSAQQYA